MNAKTLKGFFPCIYNCEYCVCYNREEGCQLDEYAENRQEKLIEYLHERPALIYRRALKHGDTWNEIRQELYPHTFSSDELRALDIFFTCPSCVDCPCYRGLNCEKKEILVSEPLTLIWWLKSHPKVVEKRKTKVKKSWELLRKYFGVTLK